MKTELIKFRADKELKEKAIKKAKLQNRTLSNYITDLIENDSKPSK